MTNSELKLIKENSYLKLGIIHLIEQMTGIKEYRDVRKFLLDLITDEEEKKELDKKRMEAFFENLKEEKNES